LTDEKGVFCTRFLADMGADVIRVERVGKPPAENPFLTVGNLGKRSVTLELETEAGRGIFKKLVRGADVLVESCPPGYLDSWGIDYAGISPLNPRLVMASITDFGQEGIYRGYQSCDMVTSALGGQLSVCGEPTLPPLKPFGQQAYYAAGLFAAIGVLLALRHRRVSGRGQHLDISAQECVAASLDHVLVRYFHGGVVARRQGSRHWDSAFRVFSCRDGYILLSLFQQWETLIEWLDSEGAADDLTGERWRDRKVRLKHLDHIIEVLERWTRSHTVAELVEQGQLMRFPWAEVSSLPGVLANSQLGERRFFVEVAAPLKRYKIPGVPCRLSRSPWRVGNRVPSPGEHNEEIYRGELGLSKEEITTLIAQGII